MTVWNNVSANSRIIIIHPNYRHPRYLLSTLLMVGEFAYWRFDENVTNAEEWLAVFKSQGTESKIEFIILDEFDRIAETLAQAILELLLKEYPKSRLVIFSRKRPTLNEPLQSLACLYPTDDEMLLTDYINNESAASSLLVEVFGFGHGAVFVNGKRIDDWESDLQCLLFFYIVHHGSASRETLLNVFFKNEALPAATRMLSNQKMRLDALLGKDKKIIIYKSKAYRINPKIDLRYDIGNYEQCLELADKLPRSQKAAMYSQARDIYTGDFLMAINNSWAEDIRAKFTEMQADVTRYLAMQELDRDEAEKASALFFEAFKYHPRDDIVAELMRLFMQLHNYCAALDLFKRYSEVLLDKLNIQPEPSLRLLAFDAEKACKKHS